MRVMLCVLVFWGVLVCRLRLRRALRVRVRVQLPALRRVRQSLVVQRLLVLRLLRLRLLFLELLLLLLLPVLLWPTWFLLLWLLLEELLLSSFKNVFAIARYFESTLQMDRNTKAVYHGYMKWKQPGSRKIYYNIKST
jgi:hypothetical protein